MKDRNFGHRLGMRMRTLRRAQGLTLEALANASGVSKSMISLIERGESDAGASLLDKLAAALGVPVSAFFALSIDSTPSVSEASVLRGAERPIWRDHESGYVRRSLSPPASGTVLLTEVELPAGASVNFANGAALGGVEQQVWVMAGKLVLDIGDRRHRLMSGDCIVMRLDKATRFTNEDAEPVRYLVAVSQFLRS